MPTVSQPLTQAMATLCIQWLCTVLSYGKLYKQDSSLMPVLAFHCTAIAAQSLRNNFVKYSCLQRLKVPIHSSIPKVSCPLPLLQGVTAQRPGPGPAPASASVKIWWAGYSSDWNCPRWFCQKHIRVCTDKLFSQQNRDVKHHCWGVTHSWEGTSAQKRRTDNWLQKFMLFFFLNT